MPLDDKFGRKAKVRHYYERRICQNIECIRRRRVYAFCALLSAIRIHVTKVRYIVVFKRVHKVKLNFRAAPFPRC